MWCLLPFSSRSRTRIESCFQTYCKKLRKKKSISAKRRREKSIWYEQIDANRTVFSPFRLIFKCICLTLISASFLLENLFFSSKKYRNVRLQFCSQIIQVYFLKRLSTYFVIRTHKTSQKAPFNRIYRFNTNHNYTEESEKNKVPKSDQRVCKKWHRDKQIT